MTFVLVTKLTNGWGLWSDELQRVQWFFRFLHDVLLVLFLHLISISKFLEKASVQFVLLEMLFHVESIAQKWFLLWAVCHVSPNIYFALWSNSSLDLIWEERCFIFESLLSFLCNQCSKKMLHSDTKQDRRVPSQEELCSAVANWHFNWESNFSTCTVFMADNSRGIHRHWHFLNYKTLPAADITGCTQTPAGVNSGRKLCTRSLLSPDGEMVQIFHQALLAKDLYSLIVFQ